MKNRSNEFTKAHTQVAKGVAIILMMIHHLFAFPERIQNVSYISILPFGKLGLFQNTSVEFLLGDFAKICVAMYLFLSGYGLYKSSCKKENFTIKDSFKKMMKFLINYWVVFVIFVPIGLIWFKGSANYHFNIVEFMKNFFTLSTSYNGEWWFVRLYIELLLFFPLVKKVLKGGIVSTFMISLGIYSISIIMEIVFIDIFHVSYLQNSFIYNEVMNLLFWQMAFCMGYITAKFNLFSYVNKHIYKTKLNNKFFYLAVILAIICIRIEFTSIFKIIEKGNSSYFDFILAPLLILACTNFVHHIKGENIVSILGKNSTNIWLTHTFFCFYYFQGIVFLPRLSILILIWLAALSLATSFVINFVIKILTNMLQKKNYQNQINKAVN